MVGDLIKKHRVLKELTQKELADLLDVSPSTVGMYEQNRRIPDAEILVKISNIFNVTVDYLLGNSDQKKEQYYFDNETAELAQELLENNDFKVLMSASRKLSKDDLDAVIKVINSMRSGVD